ncbi:MAG TPA: asparaginase [Gemmatimonadaceae bacterium]|nr:asparaginase [Gemmatimonadaceae bacterium]
MHTYDLDVVVTRGELIESRHRVHAAVVDARGTLIARAGNPELFTCWRSGAKPFQVMPFLASGHADALGWGARETAIACGSHGGEPEHVALVRAMLDAVGLEEGDLACGAHEPLSRRGVRILQQAGERPSRLHNNCSGKHAAMLAFAVRSNWPVLAYEQQGHPVQDRVTATVAEWSDVPADALGTAVDGCGALTFALPLIGMAAAFARLAEGARRGEELPARIVRAMTEHADLVGGTDRFDTVLMQETNGHVLAKVGAEGVHSLAVLDSGIGIALKVEDGAARAQHPAALRVLQHLGALPEPLPERLDALLCTSLSNTRGEPVGAVCPAR